VDSDKGAGKMPAVRKAKKQQVPRRQKRLARDDTLNSEASQNQKKRQDAGLKAPALHLHLKAEAAPNLRSREDAPAEIP
jgi:hypothetical protein